MPKTSARLLVLLSLLQARRDWPGTLLAERLEVSARTVRRDVGRLRELGYPIVTTKGPDGGYRLGAGSRPPLLFDDEQAVALTVALQLATVGAAVHHSEVLRFGYAATSPRTRDDQAPIPPRRVEPHHLVSWGGRWYLVAWDLDRADWRTFRADRIDPRTPTARASLRAHSPRAMSRPS